VNEDMEREIRRILAEVLRKDVRVVAALPDDTLLFNDELGLDSLAGARVIAMILEEFEVDIAAEDLNLDSLETIATLRDFVAARTPGRAL
jgi:acyl carrier protein